MKVIWREPWKQVNWLGMSRQPIGKGDRVTIILNPAIPKEKLILEYLGKSFNKSSDIKDILYDYFIGNQCTINNKSITNDYTINDNSLINECVKNDNKIINELSFDKKTFEINLDAIEDKSMEISQSNETVLDDVTNNALNFMLNM
ncbi:hypothetical protein [Clostridium butyricum]|uniref:hypothetical protein n=2 Tax=Clostridium butyricum TaxID=1492 RepID=UPI001072A82C|nr:hypothetical protein [Clostridium butyricum]